MIAVVLGIVVIVILSVLSIGYFISGPRYAGPVTDHFDGKRFINPGNVAAKGLPDVLKWMMTRKRGQWTFTPAPYGPKPADRIHDGIRITFVNHSTFLIQLEGINILTDPLWSKRTSPVEWAGPQRMRPPGLRLEDLPALDVLLLSHNHWDHLDIATVRHIYEQHRPTIIAPLGVKAFLEKSGVMGSADMDWWQTSSLPGELTVQSVPAQHFSGRGIFDRDGTLWCGYVIKGKFGSIYFAGDTGYNSNTFKEIGARCGPIDVALVPIGAFKPTWFMSPIHCSPAEAITIHREVGARISIASHFGTFPLADDGQTEPIEELRKVIRETKLDPSAFRILTEGEPADLKG